MEYGYMKKLTVEGDSYNVIRIGADTLEELVEKRGQYIENGYEESTCEEWLDNGGTSDEVSSEAVPVIAPDVYAEEELAE